MTDNPVTAAQDARHATISCISTLFRYHGLAVSGEALHRELIGIGEIAPDEIIRIARRHDLKAKRTTTKYSRLGAIALPALAGLKSGGYLIIARHAGAKVLIHRGAGARAELVPQAEFEAEWDGSLLLIARRARLSDLSRNFGIPWFMAAIYKYRAVLSQVLLASFFLQVFALI